VAPIVAALRARGNEVRSGEFDRLVGRLGELDDRQREVVEALAAGIVGKLLHEPTVRLKDAAGTARGERLAEALRDLFDL
jgi:glutamyl-tRNA reductase